MKLPSAATPSRSTGSAPTQSLYWKGTYQAPATQPRLKWTSQGDTETMASALLASQDATKDFTYSEADGVSWGDHRARYHHHPSRRPSNKSRVGRIKP